MLRKVMPLWLMISVGLSGCALLAPPPPPPAPVEPEITYETFTQVPSRGDADPISEAVEQMADQMIVGLTQNRVKRFPIAVLPFASLRNSVPDALMGDRLSESFIFPMQQRGYNLVDYRAVSLTTTVKPAVSAQNISALRQRYKIYFVLTGTYAHHADGVVINARILDTTTRQVLASGQAHIPNDRLEGALPGYDPVKALNNGYIIENGSGPRGVE